MRNAELKFAVALLRDDEESILGLFKTKEEADNFGRNNPVPEELGLQFCYATMFQGEKPVGNSINIYDYYNRTI